MAEKKPTIKDLAAELSLSTATISLSLSGQGEAYRIAPETRRRIEDAAKRLGYRPNHLARSMRIGRSDTIGVVFPDISEAYMNRVLSGIEKVCRHREVSMIIATSSMDPQVEARNLQTLMDKRVDGLILLPYAPFNSESYDPEPLKTTCNSAVPTVAVDRYIPGLTPYAVIGADRAAAIEATQRLIDTGCRHLAYLGFNLKISSLEERRRGFHECVEHAASEGRADSAGEFLVNEQNPESPDIRNWIADLYERGGNGIPDGFLVSSEGLALKLRSLLVERSATRTPGRPQPRIARFGEDSRYFPTNMIAVRQPHREMGRLATEKLLLLIAGETPETKIDVVDMEILDMEKNK